MLPNAVLDVFHGDIPDGWSQNQLVQALTAAYGVGVRVLIVKASEGTSPDPATSQWVAAAQAAGLQVALYHFGHTGDVPSQVATFVAIAKRLALSPIAADLPFPRYWLDWEKEDPGATGGVQVPPMTQVEAEQFEQMIVAALGECGTYAGGYAKDTLNGKADPVLGRGALWLADYSSAPTIPAPTWQKWLLWQRTDQFQSPGFPKNLDVSDYAGNRLGRWGLGVRVALAGAAALGGFVVGGPIGAVAAAAAAGTLIPKVFKA